MQLNTLVVGTDGSPAGDQRVREAARLARARNVPLHVVCGVQQLTRHSQRRLDDHLPADMAWLAGPSGQREAAMLDVRGMLGATDLELDVSATTRRLGPAVRARATALGAQVYPHRSRRVERLPLLRLRPRTTG